jgi:KDO2-lipid IV(A) lauroyltransferase
MQQTLAADMEQAAEQINRAMQALILQKPQQYLWGYARYKKPKGLEP